MIDKIQKIRNEVERLFSHVKDSNFESDSGAFYYLKDLLDYIDSLQVEPVSKEIGDYDHKAVMESLHPELKEEPVSEDLEEAADNALNNVLNTHEIVNVRSCLEMFRFGAQWQKEKDESITEDLGEYINELSKQFSEVSFAKLSRIAVRVAKWQEKQDQSTIELAEDHAMLAGMEKMKEEMMAKAIDAHVNYAWSGLSFGGFDWSKTGLDIGDKCKLIIIKED